MEQRLKIELKDIPAEGLHVSDDFSNEYLELTNEDYVYFQGPVHVEAFVKKMLNIVISECHVKGTFLSYCSRTFKDIKKSWDQKFRVEILVESDVMCVNLGEEIRQEIVLRLPIKLLSDEEAAKEKENPVNEKSTIDGIHQPFADLKDID